MDERPAYEVAKGLGEVKMDKFITAIQWLFGVIAFGLYGGIEFAQSWMDAFLNVINMTGCIAIIYLLQKIKQIWIYNKKREVEKRKRYAIR